MKFEKNIGSKNRIARLILGVILLLVSVPNLETHTIAAPIGTILGIILLLEAIFAYCLWHGLRGTKDMR